MSRIAKRPIEVPKGVEIQVSGQTVTAKGPKGNNSIDIHDSVGVNFEDATLSVQAKSEDQGAVAMAGTMRSLLNNLVTGVNVGFEKKLELVGVGYRAQAQGSSVNLSLGFSHPVVHKAPEGVTIETPTQTEIIVKGVNKQVVGQVASDIRSYRPPEPYKGKGVRYAGERIIMKEAKKK